MKYYGLYDPSISKWAKSGGTRLEFWGLERARAAWLEWMTAQAHMGAEWSIREIRGPAPASERHMWTFH